AVALDTVDAGDSRIRQRAAPFGIDQDHQLRYQLIDRRATPTLDDAHALVLDVEVIVHLDRPDLLGASAARFQDRGQLPQELELIRKRKLGERCGQAVFV